MNCQSEPRQMHITVLLRTDTEQGHYLRECARDRDISLTRLTQTLVDKIAADHLITAVLDDADGRERKKHEHRHRKVAP
jgi:hypothetical protein